MLNWKNLFGSRCFSPSCKDCLLPDPRLVEASVQIEGRQRAIRVAKVFVLVCYCLALNIFMAYVVRFGLSTASFTVAAILLASFMYFVHLYVCEKVDVDNGKLRTIRSLLYALAIIYIMLMLMCFSTLLLSSDKKLPNV